MNEKKVNFLAVLALLGANLFWAANAVIGRALANQLNPGSLVFIRWSIALALVSLMSIKHYPEIIRYLKTHPFRSLIFGLLSVALYNTFLYYSAIWQTSINITLINTLIPLATLILAMFILKEKITLNKYIGIAISFLGVVFIATKGTLNVISGLTVDPGMLMMLLATVVWGLYSVLINKWKPGLHPVSMSFILILCGYLFIVPVTLSFDLVKADTYNMNHWHLYLFVGIFPSIVSNLLWYYGVKNIGAGNAAFAIYSMPVMSSGMGILFLGESISYYHIIALACIFLGFYINKKQIKISRKRA